MSETTIQKQRSQTVPERMDQTTCFMPLVDIVETDDAFIFRADLPGVKAGDVEITYEGGVLSITGKVAMRHPVDRRYLWQDYSIGHFYRQFSLNTPVDAEQIRAEFKYGALELRAPKAESSKTRKIQIKSA